MMNFSFDSIKGVVFDFDGVILDSAGIKSEAFPELFSHRPDCREAIREHHLANQGISRYCKFAHIYEHIFHQPLSEAESRQLGEKFSRLVLQRVIAAPFIPGALAFLRALNDRGILCFVASGTPVDELRYITKARKLDQYFTLVEGSPKSKATIVNDIKKTYGLQAGEMVFLGDATTDYEAAKATGLSFIAIDTPEMTSYWKQEQVTLGSDLTPLIHRLKVADFAP